ncbi:tyrosine-type recombinase/integrase [Nonomuraea sp. 10N515B]|uniref:tyrosine-type recombinase/integrase n=1 Tax=Nonomuraea sp. 10N515B TaxID=3457422 RepID=UPI003FCD0001
MGRLLFYSGLRIAELVALDETDVPLSARKGKVIVRNGKGETSREVPLLDATVRETVKGWKKERSQWLGAGGPALFLNRYRGGRLSARAIDQLLDELAAEADLVDDTARPPPPRTLSPPTCCARAWASSWSPSSPPTSSTTHTGGACREGRSLPGEGGIARPLCLGACSTHAPRPLTFMALGSRVRTPRYDRGPAEPRYRRSRWP